MELKISKVLEIRSGLTSFKKKDLPGWLAFRLARAIKPLTEVAATFDETQLEVVKKHGKPSAARPGEYVFETEDGKFDRAKFDAYQEEMQTILDTKVDVEMKDKIDPKELEKLDVSVTEAEALEHYVA